MSFNHDRKEERFQKKIKRVGRLSGWCVGLGIGLLLARFIAPLIASGDSAASAKEALSNFGVALIMYGALMLTCFMFVQRHLLKINLIMTYLIMPILLFKMFMDIM